MNISKFILNNPGDFSRMFLTIQFRYPENTSNWQINNFMHLMNEFNTYIRNRPITYQNGNVDVDVDFRGMLSRITVDTDIYFYIKKKDDYFRYEWKRNNTLSYSKTAIDCLTAIHKDLLLLDLTRTNRDINDNNYYLLEFVDQTGGTSVDVSGIINLLHTLDRKMDNIQQPRCNASIDLSTITRRIDSMEMRIQGLANSSASGNDLLLKKIGEIDKKPKVTEKIAKDNIKYKEILDRINRINTIEVVKTQVQYKDLTCCICLNDELNIDQFSVLNPCGHLLCTDCSAGYDLSKMCPQCRLEIKTYIKIHT